VTVREIKVELPPEPPMRSVVLVDLKDVRHGGLDGDECAFQRMQQHPAGGWYMTGRDVGSRPFSWSELIGMSDGRPILVLWEPS
jgi:hypothetical protein